MFLNAILHSEILLKFHQKCGFFKYLTFNLVCLSQKWCNLTKIHYIGTYMMCSKEKATFGPIFDQLLQALINTLGPQWNHSYIVCFAHCLPILLCWQSCLDCIDWTYLCLAYGMLKWQTIHTLYAAKTLVMSVCESYWKCTNIFNFRNLLNIFSAKYLYH